MDAWINSASGISSLASTTASNLPTILNYSDPLLSQILTAKKGLQLSLESSLFQPGDAVNVANGIAASKLDKTAKSLVELLLSSCEGDLVTLESVLRAHPELTNRLFPTEEAGVTALIYAVCFNNVEVADSLLSNHEADPDLSDTIVGYTPLMWAVHFNQLEIAKLLILHEADPFRSPKDNGKSATSLILPENTEMYEYFRSHNFVEGHDDRRISGENGEEYFARNSFHPEDPVDDLSAKLKLQTIGQFAPQEEEPEEINEEDDERVLIHDAYLTQLDEFEYDKLLPEQYLKFSDSDIPSILDYVFSLRSKNTQLQHDTKIPAAIVFQLLRYAHLKVDSDELSEFFFECFVARLRSVTNTKSGVFNMALQDPGTSAGGAGDIVLLSYWLSVIQYLHFYLSRSETYAKYPKFLQELINLVQSLIATLSFSINSRLTPLIDDCLLNFTSLVDVSNVLYAKDWNLFKKSKTHPSTYDDIFDMLFPPSQNELMKPSPIRYVQVIGALDYVLKIHKVENLFRIQAFSQVFYYTNCIIFNKIISQSKYCSRSKAIQIRLNISAIEDWLRSHNIKVYKPESPGGLSKLTKKQELVFTNLLKESKEEKASKDPHYLSFYYNSLYYVGKTQLQPTIELLQWLQCMSSLTDEESLINTINQFDSLNYYQLHKVMNKLYKYEVGEPKLPKKLTYLVRSLLNEQGQNQINRSHSHYMTQTNFLTKEIYVYLNPNFIFDVALPNLTEGINNHGSGLGGIKVLRAKKYQPSLPMTIMDDIDEIFTENKNSNFNDTYDYEHESDVEEDDVANYQEKVPDENNKGAKESTFDDFKGDEIFKQVQMPNSLAHKNWGGDKLESFEENPW
ncbi:myosin class V heavy chain [Scheffersomyces xylosifermentans]|uniref:myosin class V heavy chain n=1 Tax=Scheffersomyces xylosifermentans TaxID=1304137 RepID=UPI00315D3E9B